MAQRLPGRGYQADALDDLPQQRLLGTYPEVEFVNLECLKCDRKGRLRRERLLAEYGAEMGLVTLINILRPKDCPLNCADYQGFNRCGACYGPELNAGLKIAGFEF